MFGIFYFNNIKNPKYNEQPLKAGHKVFYDPTAFPEPPPVLSPRWNTLLYLHITQRPTQGAQLFRPLLSQVEEISLFSQTKTF